MGPTFRSLAQGVAIDHVLHADVPRVSPWQLHSWRRWPRNLKQYKADFLCSNSLISLSWKASLGSFQWKLEMRFFDLNNILRPAETTGSCAQPLQASEKPPDRTRAQCWSDSEEGWPKSEHLNTHVLHYPQGFWQWIPHRYWGFTVFAGKVIHLS